MHQVRLPTRPYLQDVITSSGTNGSVMRIYKTVLLWIKAMGRTPIVITHYYDAESGMIILPLPTLNATFIEDNPPVDRIVAVGAEANGKQFIFDARPIIMPCSVKD